MLKKYFILLLISFLVFSKSSYAFFSSSNNDSSYVIMDYNTGKIIESKDPNELRYPASLTKLMTLYILFEQIHEGKISLNDRFIVSKKASRMPPTKIWLTPGSTIAVKDAINALIVRSANDVAYCVAENLGGGDVNNFIDMMNAKAKELGLKNTHFMTPNGLPNKAQLTTALDIAILSRDLITHFNDYYYLFSQRSFTWGKHKYASTNHLLNYEGVDGMKTGYTVASGFNLVASSEHNGIRIIAVSLKNRTARDRDNFVKKLVSTGLVLATSIRNDNIRFIAPPKSILTLNKNLDLKLADKDINMNFDYTSSKSTLINYEPTQNRNSLAFMSDLFNYQNVDLLNNKTEVNKTYDADYDSNTGIISSSSAVYEAPISEVNTPKTKSDYRRKNLNKKKLNKNHTYKTSATKNSTKYYTSQKPKPTDFIQVGAFKSLDNAYLTANKYMRKYSNLKHASLVVSPRKQDNNTTLYRIRFYGLTKSQAQNTCSNFNKNSCFLSY